MDLQHPERSQTRQPADPNSGRKPSGVFKKSLNATKRYGKRIRTSSPDIDHYDQIPLRLPTPRKAEISTRMKDKAGRKTPAAKVAKGSRRRASVFEGRVTTAVDQQMNAPSMVWFAPR